MREHWDRVRRQLFWRNLAISLVLDVLFVLAFVWLFQDEVEPIAVGLGLLALWGASLILAVRAGIGKLVLLRLTNPDMIGREFLDLLRTMKLQWPDWVPTSFHGLAMIADDSDVDAETRVKAASLDGQWRGTMAHLPATKAVLIESGLDWAIQQYVGETPTPP